MSAGARAAVSGGLPVARRRGIPTASLAAASAPGVLALLTCVGACVYLALGAADGRYLLELPTAANPYWIDGPLRGFSGAFGALGPEALSVGLIVLAAGYALALLCASSLHLRAVMLAIALANLAFTLGPTIVSTDVFGYIAYAREVASHGLNPYVSQPVSLHGDALLQFVYWKHQPSPYGPLFTLISAPLGLLSGSAALWSFKAIAGIASVATAWLAADIARTRGADPARAAIFVGLNPVVLFYAVSGAHNDLLAVLLVLCGIALVLRRSQGTGAGLLVAGAAIKLTVGLALPFVLLAAPRRRRAAIGAAVAMLVIGVPTLLLYGTSFFDQLHRISTNPLFDTVFSGPDRLAGLLGTQITPALRALCTAAAAAAALLAILWARRGGDAITAAGWAFAGLLAAIASLAPWYLVWLLAPAAVGRSRRLQALALLITGYFLATHIPAFGGQPWLSQAGASQTPAADIARVLAHAGGRG